MNFAGLYADGAFFFYNILNSQDFFYATYSRSVSYWLTQTPTVVATKVGVTDIVFLGRLHSAGLVVAPLAILFTAFIVARNSMVLLAGTAAVLASVYIPTSLFHIGEFQVSYSLFWLIFVLLVSNSYRGLQVAIALSILVSFAYEASAILGLEVAAISIWKAKQSSDAARKHAFFLCAVVLVTGASFNLYHALFAPVVDHARTQFLRKLLNPGKHAGIWYMFVGCLVSVSAAIVLRGRWRWFAIVIAVVATSWAGWIILAGYKVHPAFGVPYSMRAPAFLMLGTIILLASVAIEYGRDFKPDAPGCIVISLPILLAFGVDHWVARGWPRYLHDFCVELDRSIGDSAAIEFHDRLETRRYGWVWTDPFTSRLLSSAENTSVILNANPQEWPAGPLDNLVRYKRGRSICNALP